MSANSEDGTVPDEISAEKGWVRVADAVPAPGTIVESSIERRGQTDDLVVWTTASGVPCVSEARCPHQWSHLANEGAVDGEELVCVSHFWRFGVDGEGWKENVNGRRDRKGDLEVLACVEHDGGVWVQSAS